MINRIGQAVQFTHPFNGRTLEGRVVDTVDPDSLAPFFPRDWVYWKVMVGEDVWIINEAHDAVFIEEVL